MTRTIEQWKEIFLNLPNGAHANAVNCAYRLLGDLLGWHERGGHKDTDVDQISNAMLAFKTVGGEEGSASTETPNFAAQYIYVENDQLLRFIALFMLKHWWVDIQWIEAAKKFRLRFAVNIDLRNDLPASLRGKFSVNP